MKIINDLIDIILNINDNNKQDKLKLAYEEEALKSDKMMDVFPETLETFLENSI